MFDASNSGRLSTTLEVSFNSAGGSYSNTNYTVYGGFWIQLNNLGGAVGWDGLNLRGATTTGSPTSFHGSGSGSPVTDVRWRLSSGTRAIQIFRIKEGK